MINEVKDIHYIYEYHTRHLRSIHACKPRICKACRCSFARVFTSKLRPKRVKELALFQIIKLLLHETGLGYVWLTQGVCDEQHFIRIFRQRLTDIHFQDWVAGLNASSRFDHYREFKIALNAETYLDCIK